MNEAFIPNVVRTLMERKYQEPGYKVGGAVKGGDMPWFGSKTKQRMTAKKPARKPKTGYKAGGSVRGDGCVMKGKTRGREC